MAADQREDAAILRATTSLAVAGPVRSHGAGGRDTPTGVSTREWTVADGVDPMAAFADLLRDARSSTLVWHDMSCGSGQIGLGGAELLDGAIVGINAYLVLDETPFNDANTITVRAEVGDESIARADRIPERAPLIDPTVRTTSCRRSDPSPDCARG